MRGTVIPLTLGILIFGAVPGVLSDGHGGGSTTEEDMTKMDIHDALAEIIADRKAAADGCNLYKAQQCFLAMASATINILGGEMSPDDKMMTCGQVHHYRECIEESMKACPESHLNWRGMRALDPYVPLFTSVVSTVCMEEGERRDMDGCDMETAGHCLMGFFYVIADASTLSTCWQSLHSSGCLESALRECKNPYVQQMKSIISNQIRLTAALTCVEPSCNPDVAYECLMTAKYAADSPLATSYKSPILCGTFMTALTCAVNNTIGCSEETYNELANGILHVHKAVKEMCPADANSDIPENVLTQNLISMMSLTESRFITPENFCPYFKYGVHELMKASLEEVSLENVMKTSMVANSIVGDYCKKEMDMNEDCDRFSMEEHMCDVSQAEMCVGIAELSFLLAEVDVIGKETICQEVHKLAKCVNSKISGCRMDQLPPANFSFWYILGAVSDYCPIQQILTSSTCRSGHCQTMEALNKCFPTVSADDLMGGKACMLMENTMKCVKHYTSSCVMALGMVPLGYTAHYYLQQFSPYCKVPKFEELDDSVTDPSYVEGAWQMMQMLQYGLMNGSDIVQDYCHLLYMADKSINDVKPHPMIAFAIKKMHGYGEDMFNYLCKGYSEEALMHMSTANMTEAQMSNPASCEADKASYCFAMYTTSLTLFQFLSIDDRNSLCYYGYDMVMECMNNYTTGCSAERKAVFESSKAVLDVFHSSYCPMDNFAKYYGMKMDGCAPETAKFCLDWFLEDVTTMSAYHEDNTCMRAGETVKCVMRHTSNCTSNTDMSAIKSAAKSVMSIVGHKCMQKASPDLCDAVNYVSDMLAAEQATCAFSEAEDCMNLFNEAKPVLERIPEMLCHAGHKTMVCVMANGYGCTDVQQQQLNTSVQAAAASVMPLCTNMSMEEPPNPCNATYAQSQVVCNTNYLGCFIGSTTAEEICANAAAIKSCISLHLRGCGVNLVYEAQIDMAVAQDMVEMATGQTCDITPTMPPGVVAPTYTRNGTCLRGLDIQSQYLYNHNATELNLCKAWHTIHDCLLENVDKMPIMMSSYMSKVATSIAEQIRMRCAILDTENLELLYGREEKVDDWDAFLNVSGCDVYTAAYCVEGFVHASLYAGMQTVQDKEFFCGSYVTDQLKCIHNSTATCPSLIRARTMRVIDWTSSISTNLGVCSMEMPRNCDPYAATKCMADLASALLAYGDDQKENVLCAALKPVEMCVTQNTNGCYDDTRLSVEYTYATLASVVMKKCENPKLYMERKESCEEEDKCNFEKSKHCLMELAEKSWSVVEGRGNRMHVCSEAMELGECIEKNVMGCDDMQKQLIEFHGSMLKTLLSAMCDTGGNGMVPERTDSPKMCVTLAGQCLYDFMSITLTGSLTGSCGQAPTTVTCLMTAAKGDCHEPQRELIKMAIEQIAVMAKRMCSYNTCNMDLAEMCAREAGYLMHAAADRFMESKIMCSALHMSLECARNHFGHCDHTKHPFMVMHLKEMGSIAKKLCGDHHDDMGFGSLKIPDTQGLMALAAMITNPLSTKEQICPQALAIEYGISEMAFSLSSEEYDEVMKAFYIPNKIIGDMCRTEEERQPTGIVGQCDTMGAVECLNEANLIGRIGEAVFYGWEGACMSVQRLMCCVTQKMSTCQSVKLGHQIISDAVSLVADKCPMEEMYKSFFAECKMPTVESCKVADAIRTCFPDVTDANRGNVCANASAIAACVKKHAGGCSSLQSVSLQFFVNRFFQSIQPCNTLVALDWGIFSKTDGVEKMAACNYDYVHKLSEVLNSSQTSDFRTKFCDLSKQAEMCYYPFYYEIPAYVSYVLESNGRNYGKLVEYCAQEKEGQCPKPVGDSSICLEECGSDNDCSGQMKCCKNNCGRTCVMPEGVQPTSQPPVEPAGCMSAEASTCVATFWTGLGGLNMMPLDQRGKVCSQYWDMKHCVMEALADCSQERKDVFTEMDMLIKHMYDVSCEESMVHTLLMNDGLCVPDVADYCIGSLGEMIYYAPAGSEQYICKQAFKIMQCVQRSLENCSSDVSMKVIESMAPIMSLVGNSCPVASAIKCNMTGWRDIVMHAACDEDAVWKAFDHFEEFATREAKNNSAMCKAFEDMSMYTHFQTMLCEESKLTMANQTWSLMMATYGKTCMESGHMSKDFQNAMEMGEACMSQPTCSSDWNRCFSDIMDMNSEELCMKKEEIMMCVDKLLMGCDDEYKQNSLQGLVLLTGSMNMTCNIWEGVNGNMSFWRQLVNITVDPCLINLITAGGEWLHSHLNFDSSGICKMFHNFTECTGKYLEYPMPPVYGGLFKQFVQHTKTYTKLRCEINEAKREVWWEDLKDMPGMDELRDYLKEEMMKNNITVDEEKIAEHSLKYIMNTFKDMSHNTKEPEDCAIETANACMIDTVLSSVYVGYNTLGSREAACKGAHESFECVLKSTKSCNSLTRIRYLRMLEWVARLGLSSGVCQMEGMGMTMHQECDYDGAMECLGRLSQSIVYLHAGDSREALIAHLGPTEMCVTEKTWMCEPRYRKMVEDTYQDLKNIAISASMSRHNNAMDYNDDNQMDMGDMCPDEDDMRSASCDIKSALYCVNHLRENMREMHSEDQVCRAMASTQICVKRNMMGCRSREADGVWDMMKEIAERAHCSALECDVCSARSCVRRLHRAVMHKEASCVDVWRTQQCVKEHMEHCDMGMMHNVSMELKMVMKNVTASVCEFPTVSVEDCTMGLVQVSHKILGLGVDLEDIMMSMDDRMEDVPDMAADDKDERDDTKYDENNDTSTARPTTAPAKETMEDDKPDMLNGKQIMFLERLLTLVGGMKKGDDCKMGEMKDDDSMESMCQMALMSWYCVESHLSEVPEGMRSVANTSLHLIGEALTAKCTKETQKEPMTCFSCKDASSNEECNAQQPQTCHGKRQACYTVVDNGRISKGCTYRVPLQQTSECVNWGRKCMHICDKSQCNWRQNTALVDPPTCNKRAATLCGMTLVGNMLRSSELNCGVAMKALNCVHHFTKDCMSHKEMMMSKQAEMALHSPALMRCYAKDEPCKCGYCSVVALARVQHNSFLTRVEKCEWAKTSYAEVVNALLTEDCHFDDAYQLSADVKLVRSVMADSCMEPPRPKCDIQGAETCVELSMLEHMEQMKVHEHDKMRFCSTASKTMLCVRWHTEHCDATVFNMAIAAHKDMLMKLKGYCDLGNIGNSPDFFTDLASFTEMMQEKMTDIISLVQYGYGDTVYMMGEVLKGLTTPVVGCNTGLAMRNCFVGLDYMDKSSDQYCIGLRLAADCVTSQTSQCLLVQRAPVFRHLRNMINQSADSCAARQILQEMPTDNMDDPYLQLTVCLSNYTNALQRFYLNMRPEAFPMICQAAQEMDYCIYNAPIPRAGKVYQASLAGLSHTIMQQSCSTMTNRPMNCSDDDVLCQYMMKTADSSDDFSWMSLPEPSTCDIEGASLCVTNHLFRVMSGTFSNMDEFASICWEKYTLAMCVSSKMQSCSKERQDFYGGTVAWLDSLTSVACNMVADMRLPNCSIAHECLADMANYVVSPEGYMNRDHMCWKMEKTLTCLYQHGSYCLEADMPNLREGIQMVGNLTRNFCPHSSSSFCELSMLSAYNPQAPCASSNLRECVFTFFYDTMDKDLSEADYCAKQKVAESCIKNNSTNCRPYELLDIHQAMKPGIAASGYTCPMETMDHDAMCPVYDECSVADAAMKINTMYEMASKARSEGMGDAQLCNMITANVSAIGKDLTKCSPLEVAMINKVLSNIALAIQFTFQLSCSPTPFSSALDDPVYSELENCFTEFYGSLQKAALSPEYGFYDICNTAMSFNTCMSAIGMSSDRPVVRLVHRVLEDQMGHIQEFIKTTCMPIMVTDQTVKLTPQTSVDPTCQQDTVFHCMAYYVSKVAFLPMLKSADALSVCHEYQYIRDMCVMNKDLTTGCSNVTMKQIYTIQYIFEKLAMSSPACSWMASNEWRMSNARLMTGGDMMNMDGDIEVFQDQFGSWQEAVLDSVRTMQRDYLTEAVMENMEDGKDDDDDEDKKMDDYDKDDCSPRAATECFLRTMSTLSLEDWLTPSHDRLCRNLTYMYGCMKKELDGCQEWEKKMVHESYMETWSMYEHLCEKDHHDEEDSMAMEGLMAIWLDTTEYGMMGLGQEITDAIENFMKGSDDKEMEWDEDELKRMTEMEMEEGDDVNCIARSLYRRHAKCDPKKAISILTSMDEAILSTKVSHAGLCLKTAMSTRGFLLTTEGCDWHVSSILNMLGTHTMLKIGQKCPAYVRESCRDEHSCQPRDIMRCYHKVQLHVAAIMEDKLPANLEVCEQLGEAAECVDRLRCDDRILYGVHETMEPALSTLAGMCYKMPVQTCTTSAMWKMAAIVMLGKRTYETSYALSWMKKHMNNMTNYDDSTDNTKSDDVVSSQWSEEEISKASMTLQYILGRQEMCGEDQKVNGDLATGLKYLVRYAFMYENMVDVDHNFMNMMTLAIAGELRNAAGGDYGEMVDLIRMVRERMDSMDGMDGMDNMTRPGTNGTQTHNGTMNNATRPEDKLIMEWKLRDVIGRIVSHTIVYGNSDTFTQVETHKVVKAKMKKAIENAALRGNNLELEEEDEDAFERLDLNLGKDLEDAVDWEMRNILKTVHDIARLESSNMTMKHRMELLEMAQEIHTHRKNELCMSMIGAWQCTTSTLMLLPESVRGIVNQTLNSLYSVTEHLCQQQKCYSCDGFHDNEACNNQGMETCKAGEVCFSHTNDEGIIKKGCTAPSMDDEWNYFSCMGNGCNYPKYGVWKENENDMCRPLQAVGCMYDLLPTMLQGHEVDFREMHKTFWCMEHYTATCVLEENREISRMAKRVKAAMTDGQCSTPAFVTTCGLTSILELSDLVKTAGASRHTICKTMNETINNLMLATTWHQCSEYETIMAYNQLDLIGSIVGPDYCPGLDPRNPRMCAEERAKLPPVCDVEHALGTCLYEADMLDKIMDTLGDQEDWKDMDYLCRRLGHILQCVGNHTSSCDAAQMQYVHRVVGERVGDAVPYCPSINMELAMCDETPLTEYNCRIYEGIEACLSPAAVHVNPYMLCHMNETMLDGTMECLGKYVKHCKAVQALPVSYVITNHMAWTMFFCGNHSTAKDIANGVTNPDQIVTMETLLHMLMVKSSGIMFGNEMAPMTDIVNMVLSLKARTTATGDVADMLMAMMEKMDDKEMNGTSAQDRNLMAMLKFHMGFTKTVSGIDSKPIYNIDETQGIARCINEYSVAIQRLLMYPDVSHRLACEAKVVYRQCLRKLELTPVSKMYVLGMEARIAMESDRDCTDYMDGVISFGKDIHDEIEKVKMVLNMTGAFKNASATAMALKRNNTIFQLLGMTQMESELIMGIIELMANMTSMNRTAMNNTMEMPMSGLEGAPDEILKTVVKGLIWQFRNVVNMTDSCNPWIITQHITYAYMQILTGPFFPYYQYPAMCSNLNTMFETVMPEVNKCPMQYQDVYNRAIMFLDSEAKTVCEEPFLDITPPTKCNADLADSCLKDVMPLLSSVGTERKKMCLAVEQASICMSYGLRNCNDTESLVPFLAFEQIKSIVSESCPYLTASMQCYDNSDILAGTVQICDVTNAKKCADLVTGNTDIEKCGKLPDMMNCFYRQTSSCSAIEMYDAYTHLNIVLDNVVGMCYDDRMVAQYNQVAAAIPCTQAEKCNMADVNPTCGPLIPATFTSCSDLSAFQSCVSNLIKGCSTMHLAVLRSVFGSIMSDTQLACIDIPALTSMIDYERLLAIPVFTCVDNYNREMTAALMNTSHAHEAICSAYGNLGECLVGDRSESEAMAMFAFFGTSFNMTWEVVKEICWSEDQMADWDRSRMGAMYNYKSDRNTDEMQKDGPACEIKAAAKYLSSYSVAAMFSSIMSKDDKKDFCDPKGQTAVLLDMVLMNADNCSENTKGPLHGLGAAMHASHVFSGICSEELWTCDPTSALNCGMEAGHAIMANNSLDKFEENICRVYDHSMECIKRHTFACPMEVNWRIIEKLESSFCIGYSMVKHCSSVQEKMMKDNTMIPSCDWDEWYEDWVDTDDNDKTDNKTTVIASNTTKPDDDKMDDQKVCNQTAAFECVAFVMMHLYSPMLECNSMHREYTKAMLCVDAMTKGCDGSTMLTVEAVVRTAVKKTYEICPQVVMVPCHESKNCHIDEAQNCVNVLTHLSGLKEMQDQHICLAREMTEICLKEKLQHCSVFGRTALMEAIKHATPNRHLICQGDLAVCIQKFFYNTIGVISGDLMMANMARVRGKIASEVTDHFMTNPHMVGLTEINKRIEMNMANMSREIRDAFSGNSSMMPNMDMGTPADTILMDASAYMWNMISGGMDEDYQTNHAKSKVLQCVAVREAFECMNAEMHQASWGYLSPAQATFVSQNILQVNMIAEIMCKEDTTCVFLNEPETCQVLPALWMTMSALGQVMATNNVDFCSHLPALMSNVTSLTSSCSDEVGQHFKAMLEFQREASDAICKLPTTCKVDQAVQCLATLNQANFCSENENVKSCMTDALKGCSLLIQANLTAEYTKIEGYFGQSCVKMPSFNVTEQSRPIRISEGDMNMTNILVMINEKPDCGFDCYIEVRVMLSEDASSVSKCHDNTAIPQVLVAQAEGTTSTCSMTFTDANYNAPQVVPIIPTADLIQDGNHYVTAKLTASKFVNGGLVKQTQIAEYTIVVSDTDENSACMAADDSMISFDGLLHGNYLENLFVLYKHSTLPQKVFVMKQKNQNVFGTVICGVAITSEDDVFIIDRCRNTDGVYGNTQQLYLTNNLHVDTEFYSMTNEYKVRFPSGTSVTITERTTSQGTTSLVVLVHPSPFDRGQTAGLCGVYDGMTANDMTLPNGQAIVIDTSNPMVLFDIAKNFDRQWRVRISDLFGETATYPKYNFCPCASNSDSCVDSRNSIVETCASSMSGSDITNALISNAVILETGFGRKKRQTTTGLFDNVEIDPNYDDTVTVPTWDPPRNVTFDAATAFCDQEVANAQIVTQCQQIPGFEIPVATAVADCMNRILTRDTTDGATSGLTVYIDDCEAEANLLLTSTDANLVTLASNILNQPLVCPNSCNGNGNCVAGVCQCLQNWLGDDCSINENTPPTVSSVENNGLCDISSGGCSVITILGNDFSDQKQETCHFMALNVDQTISDIAGSEVEVDANFITKSQMDCPVPVNMMSGLKWGVKVAVSNDRLNKSPYYTVVAFTGPCYSCTTSGCQTTTAGCVIDNSCYSSFTNKPNDVCHYCDASLNNTDWTMKIAPPTCTLPTTPAPPTTTTKSTVPPSPTTTTVPTTTTPTTTSTTTTRTTTPGMTPPTQPPKTTTEGPVLSQEAQLIVVVLGVVAGLFAVLACILAVKYCQRQPSEKKRNSYLPDDKSYSTVTRSSIEEEKQAYPNPAYDVGPTSVDQQTSYLHGAVAPRTDLNQGSKDPTQLSDKHAETTDAVYPTLY
ncbi:uncharacterized protein [Argopecten irradians]|uniref:uncharacterized protein isoform X2 n=1 Tax=Argopecten irradians TaxID=31199 RepID=UPI003718683D